MVQSVGYWVRFEIMMKKIFVLGLSICIEGSLLICRVTTWEMVAMELGDQHNHILVRQQISAADSAPRGPVRRYTNLVRTSLVLGILRMQWWTKYIQQQHYWVVSVCNIVIWRGTIKQTWLSCNEWLGGRKKMVLMNFMSLLITVLTDKDFSKLSDGKMGQPINLQVTACKLCVFIKLSLTLYYLIARKLDSKLSACLSAKTFSLNIEKKIRAC